MEVEIWINESEYSIKFWRNISEIFINEEDNSINQIIFNHHFKEYRKNFKCTKSQMALIIKRSKTMKKNDIENLIV